VPRGAGLIADPVGEAGTASPRQQLTFYLGSRHTRVSSNGSTGEERFGVRARRVGQATPRWSPAGGGRRESVSSWSSIGGRPIARIYGGAFRRGARSAGVGFVWLFLKGRGVYSRLNG
jgi:hypothetical protein